MARLSHNQARDILRRSQVLDKSVQESLGEEIAIVDSTGSILAVNEAWESFARKNGDPELVHTGRGQNYLDVCRRAADAGVSDAAQALRGILSVLEGAAAGFEMAYFCDSPSEHRWYLLSASPLLTQCEGAIISHRQIAVKRGGREALQMGANLRALASVSVSFLPAMARTMAFALNVRHAFICELADTDHRRIRVVAHWSGDDFGESFEYEAEGTPCAQVLDGRFCLFPDAVQSRFPADTWLADIEAESYMAVPILDSVGRPIGHLGVISSEPLRADASAEFILRMFALRAAPELERRRSEEFGALQARLIESIDDAIIGTDENFRVTTWNRAAERTYGWRREEVLDSSLPELLQTEFVEGTRAEAIRTAQETGEFRGEVVQRRRDGSRVEIEATSMALRSPAGAINGYVSVNRDITERKQVEQRLYQALTAKDQFLSLVSHELRTPITVIMGNAWSLAKSKEGEAIDSLRETGQIIYEESLKLNGIIENLLMLARTEKAEAIEVEPVRLTTLARTIVRRTHRDTGREIGLRSADETMTVLANPVATEQVINNLLSNALKYTAPDSNVALSIERKGEEAILSVSDNGPGIPAEELPRLFEPFYRARGTANVAGMGIGLSVCRRLVEAMGGEIWASSRERGGTVFSFSLPICPEEP